MGFEIGFNKIKKYDSCSFNEMLESIERNSFKNNEWLKEHYSSYEEYYKNTDLSKKPLCNPSNEIIKFYDGKEPDILDYWCSIGRKFDSDICSYLTKIDEYHYLIENKKQIESLLKNFKSWLESIEPEPAYITHSIKCLEDGSFILNKIDGIQIELENGQIRQLFFNDDEDDTIYVNSKYVEPEEIYAIKTLIKCLEEINEINLDEYFIYYWRSF